MAIATAPGGQAFIVYQDWAPPQAATAMQLNGGTWSLLGARWFSAGVINYPSAAYDAGGNLYVVYSDSANAGGATAMWNMGGGWMPLGGVNFSSGPVTFTSLAVDSGSNLWVAYSDQNAFPSGAATVMEWNGGSWIYPPGLPRGFSGGGASHTSIAIDNTNNVYVAYYDGNLGGELNVVRYDPVLFTWATVGSLPISPSSVWSVSLAINPATQEPWVAFSDAGAGGKLTVIQYWPPTNWTVVGAQGFSAGTPSGVALKFDTAGRAVVAFSDAGSGGRAFAYRFSGSTWQQLGSSVSPGAAASTCLAVDATGYLLFGFRDDVNGQYASVKRY